MNNTRNAVCICLIALSLLGKTFSSESSQNFNLKEIAEKNYVHIGKHLTVEDEGNDDIANMWFIIGDNCIAVIDTGGSINICKKFKKSIRNITNKPICYVINTHVHYDHILGNKAFANENADFVGHENLAEAINQNKDFFLTQFKKNLSEDPNGSDLISPNILIKKLTKLDLGNRVLTLIPFPNSHSQNDIVVIDEKTKTLWAGDLIFIERIPSLTGSLKGWVETIERIKKLDVKVIVPGHGKVSSSLKEALKQQTDYFELLLNKIREAIAEGKFIDEAMESIDKENQLKWLLHEYQHARNVSRTYTELEWE